MDSSSSQSSWNGPPKASLSESESLVDSEKVKMLEKQEMEDDSSRMDYSSHFTTNMVWSTMEELRNWVRQVGIDLLMVITTKTSKAGRILLHCEQGGKYRSAKKKKEGKELSENLMGPKRGKKNGCKFMLQGKFPKGDYHYSEGWRLTVIYGKHNHDMNESLSGHRFALKLTKEQRETIASCSASGIKPKDIEVLIKRETPGTLITSDQIYSYKAMERRKSRGNLTITQYSLQFLKDKGYFTGTLSEYDANGNLVWTDLFISYPDSRHLLRMFPNVVIMDTTYKTNKYGKPLLEFVGFTSTTHTYCIALVFMKQETTEHYTWALKRLKWLFGKKTPLCFMSDRELGAIKGVQNVFGDVRHLLCQVHVDRNVRAYAKTMGVDSTRFCSSVRRVMRSHTEKEYEERLVYFREKWKSGAGGGLVGYVESTWFIPHKEKLVSAWSDDVRHFATRSSNRVESQHAMLKNMLGSSVGGLDSIVQHIDNMFTRQIHNIKDEMGKSTYMTPIDILKAPSWMETFFSRLKCRVSRSALDLLKKQAILAKEGQIPDVDDRSDRWWTTTMGLPAPRRIKIYVEEDIPCPIADIDLYWRQIKWNGLDGTDTHEEDNVLLSAGQIKLNTFFESYKKNEVSKDLVYLISERIDEYISPVMAKHNDPEVAETKKGRPKKKAPKTSTKRDDTWEEHVDLAIDEAKPESAVVVLGKASSRGRTKKSSQSSRARRTTVSQSHPSHPSLDDPDCTITGATTLFPKLVYQPIIYLGFNWGVENVDSFMLAYISRVQDVIGDGNCGYRSLSVLMGGHEDMYATVRFELSKFIQRNLNYWQMVREEPRDINELIMEINVVSSPCPQRCWMSVPFMALVFATTNQCAVVVLSWFGPCTCLPLFAPPGSDPPSLVICLSLVGLQNHFVPVWLVNDYCPIPPPPRQWTVYKNYTVEGWETHPRFSGRFERFVRERELAGRPPIMN